jgi:hypothetical protein
VAENVILTKINFNKRNGLHQKFSIFYFGYHSILIKCTKLLKLFSLTWMVTDGTVPVGCSNVAFQQDNTSAYFHRYKCEKS